MNFTIVYIFIRFRAHVHLLRLPLPIRNCKLNRCQCDKYVEGLQTKKEILHPY